MPGDSRGCNEMYDLMLGFPFVIRLSLMNRLKSNRVCYFHTLDAAFPKDLFFQII